MLSQLKSYLFGGASSDVDSTACAADTGVVVLPSENDDDWVLVDSQGIVSSLTTIYNKFPNYSINYFDKYKIINR